MDRAVESSVKRNAVVKVKIMLTLSLFEVPW